MESTQSQTETIRNLFVKLLNGKTLTLKFNSPKISGETLIHKIQSYLPIHKGQINLLFLTEGRHVSPESELTSNDHGLFPTVHVLCRLRGGKGGFGSLLRGAATKAGQKKTNNFDACRDMNGRRLRHVNAEKKLEEWREEEEGRGLVKLAEEQFRKNAKKHAEDKKNANGESAKEYVDKCKKVSEECMARIERSVRESFAKRKGVAGMKGAGKAKKLKIWMGNTNMEDSDSDSDKDGIDNEGSDKSVVLNNKHHMDSSLVSCEKLGETSGGDFYKYGSEENIGVAGQGCAHFSSSPGVSIDDSESAILVEPDIHEMVAQSFNVVTEVIEVEKHDRECSLGNMQEIVSQTLCDSSAPKEGIECIAVNPEANGFPENINKSAIVEEKVITNINFDVEKPLNFDDYNSAAEMEVLGMERLKSELQAHGLKCGGTLQERVARLFLLKTTPLEKIPKKLLAKK